MKYKTSKNTFIKCIYSIESHIYTLVSQLGQQFNMQERNVANRWSVKEESSLTEDERECRGGNSDNQLPWSHE